MSKPVFARTISVNKKDLPVCCPQMDEALWCAHPRVYLPIEGKEMTCYYCSTRYVVVEENEHHPVT
jgi:uncharacterized Zn-finger protein